MSTRFETACWLLPHTPQVLPISRKDRRCLAANAGWLPTCTEMTKQKHGLGKYQTINIDLVKLSHPRCDFSTAPGVHHTICTITRGASRRRWRGSTESGGVWWLGSSIPKMSKVNKSLFLFWSTTSEVHLLTNGFHRPLPLILRVLLYWFEKFFQIQFLYGQLSHLAIWRPQI